MQKSLSFFSYAILVMIAVSRTASAEPLSLVCNGETTVYEGQNNIPIENAGAVVDLDRSIFHSPVYGDFTIAREDATAIVFTGETEKASMFGNLDRISGAMFIFVMKPDERKKYDAKQPFKLISYVKATCRPFKRLF